MTVTGNALTEALYGEAPGYAYFSGCSTGGRQALMEAQPRHAAAAATMFITLDWLRYFLTQNPDFDWTTVTPAGYERL